MNFSRGELVNEEDLRVALEEGILGSYITDFPNENVLGMKKMLFQFLTLAHPRLSLRRTVQLWLQDKCVII
ncbi:hypothetical protein GCM10020331_058480 [Ectobacillus funiculus]